MTSTGSEELDRAYMHEYLKRAAAAIANNEEAKRLKLGGYADAERDPSPTKDEIEALVRRMAARHAAKGIPERVYDENS